MTAPEADRHSLWPAYHGEDEFQPRRRNLMGMLHRSSAGRPRKPFCGARYDGLDGLDVPRILDSRRTNAGLTQAGHFWRRPRGPLAAAHDARRRRRQPSRPPSSSHLGLMHARMEPPEVQQIPTRGMNDPPDLPEGAHECCNRKAKGLAPGRCFPPPGSL